MESKRLLTHRFIPAAILIILLISTLGGCRSKFGPSPEPAQNGIMDLSDWDFSADGPVKLEGEWEFFWNEFINPSVPDGTELSGRTNYIGIPTYWNNHEINGSAVGSQGYASYRLKLILPKDTGQMAFRYRDVQTAYQVYVNGALQLSSGQVGRNAAESVPYYTDKVEDYNAENNELDIVVLASNFHHRNGGMWELIEIGPRSAIRRNYELALTADMFLIGFIMAMGLYHITRFLLRRSDMLALYFGLFCILIAVRTLVVGNMHAQRLFPEAEWQLFHKIEYISYYAALPLFMSYLYTAFPGFFPRLLLRISQFLGLCFSLIVAIFPALIYSHSLPAYQIITLVSGLFALSVLIRAAIHRDDGAIVLLTGFFFLFLMVVNDLLYVNQIIHTGYLMPWGQLIFLISQAYLIARTAAQVHRRLVESNEMLAESRLGIILGLAKLAEYRDEDTGIHLERIREYCRIIAEHLAELPVYRGYITGEYIDDLYHSSILHDIGKVGIPDAILLKPGRLSSEEFDVIKRHTRLGGDAISDVEDGMNARSFLTLGKQIAYNHHERWDGSGYPRGLAGNDIPLTARIVALADVYDALRSKRPYKDPFTHEKTREMILSERGRHFDPDVVDAFLANEKLFASIRNKMHEITG